MKKAICILMAAILLAGTVSGCGEAAFGTPKTTQAANTLSVEQTVLFDKPYGKVTAQSITKNGDEYTLELWVTNTGTERIDIEAQDVTANGLTVPATCSGMVSPRKSGAVTVKLDCSSVFSWGMDKLETIGFSLWLRTEYSNDVVPVTVKVNQEGSCGTLNMDGTTVLEQDGVTVQYKIVDDWPVYLLVNNTDSELNIYTDDLTINGISEYYPGSRQNWVQAGQTIVTGPDRVRDSFVPTAETMEIAFKIRVRFPESDTEIISNRITHLAPFTINNWGLSEEFVLVFDNDGIKISLGTIQVPSRKAPDLCIWICNDTDEELVVTIPALRIDGRKISVYEIDKKQEQYYFENHTIEPHSQDIQSLTSGGCGTPAMYGGIREVYIPMSILLGDTHLNWQTDSFTVEFPEQP